MQVISDIDHRTGEMDGLLHIQRQYRRCGQEGRKCDIGIATIDHITDDRLQLRRLQSVAVNSRTHGRQRFEHWRMPNLHKIALMDVQGIPGGLGQSDLSGFEQIAVDLVQQRLHSSVAGDDQYL